MSTKQVQEPAMSDVRIVEVFKTLRLPLDPPSAPVAQQTTSIIYFPITGNSPPLQAR